MSLSRASVLGHRRMTILNPIASDDLDRIVGAMSLPSPPQLFDAGCRKAELLIRVLERHGGHATGVDISAEFIADAQDNARDRVAEGTLDLRVADLNEIAAPVNEFDLIARVGAPWAGTFEGTIDWIARGLRAGGFAVFGEGYWRRRPDTRYLESLGAEEEDMTNLEGLQRSIRSARFDVVQVAEASDADWERYETGWRDGILDFVREHPHDPDAPELSERARQGWHRFDVLGAGRHSVSPSSSRASPVEAGSTLEICAADANQSRLPHKVVGARVLGACPERALDSAHLGV